MAVGDGQVGERTHDFHIRAGDTVLYSKFGIGVTDITVQGEEHCLIREGDCIGVLPRPGATADDIPQLKPAGDRVLLKASLDPTCCSCFHHRIRRKHAMASLPV